MRALALRNVCNGVGKAIFQATVPQELFPVPLAVAGRSALTLCLVPQLFMNARADGCLMFASYNMDLTGEGSTFLFFIFLVCCMLGEAKVPS
jgi:hypothetical protein